MLKKEFLLLIMLPFLYGCAEEEEFDLRGSTPTITLDFFTGNTAIDPDSIGFSNTNSIRRYANPPRTYVLPLNFREDSTTYIIYQGNMTAQVTVLYELDLIEDIDKIRYTAIITDVNLLNLSKAELTCRNNVRCTANETTINLYF